MAKVRVQGRDQTQDLFSFLGNARPLFLFALISLLMLFRINTAIRRCVQCIKSKTGPTSSFSVISPLRTVKGTTYGFDWTLNNWAAETVRRATTHRNITATAYPLLSFTLISSLLWSSTYLTNRLCWWFFGHVHGCRVFLWTKCKSNRVRRSKV